MVAQPDDYGAFRSNHQIKRLFTSEISNAQNLFLLGSSDLGVCRNLGRRGARFAPEALVNTLKKMSAEKQSPIFAQEVGCNHLEQEDFDKAQKLSTTKIADALKSFKGKTIFHLGGGHDHIFPLLMALPKLLHESPNICVINIDAHLDTRTDPLAHSGTPFRQFSSLHGDNFRLIQLGIHDFANPKDNFEKVPNMEVFTYGQLAEESKNFTIPMKNKLKELIGIKKDEITVLSLDCDGIAAESMEAVSAVNHKGLPLSFVGEIFDYYKENSSQPIYGIYEYNPICDGLNQKGARLLAELIYRSLS